MYCDDLHHDHTHDDPPGDAVGERPGWLLRNDPALPHGGLSLWPPAKLVKNMMIMMVVVVKMIMMVVVTIHQNYALLWSAAQKQSSEEEETKPTTIHQNYAPLQ